MLFLGLHRRRGKHRGTERQEGLDGSFEAELFFELTFGRMMGRFTRLDETRRKLPKGAFKPPQKEGRAYRTSQVNETCSVFFEMRGDDRRVEGWARHEIVRNRSASVYTKSRAMKGEEAVAVDVLVVDIEPYRGCWREKFGPQGKGSIHHLASHQIRCADPPRSCRSER